MRHWLVLLLCVVAALAQADEHVAICYNYGCLSQTDIRYTEGQLGDVRRLLFSAKDAAEEREKISLAIGRLYAWAGEQSLIRNDRGGNYADDGVSGRMDCIDHSTSTTRLLELLAGRGYLRWHRVLAPDVRYFALLIPAHYSAVLEEKSDDASADEAPRFVVDSWFVDNGQPAVILPLADWKKGAGPDV
jgi:hypothetical protein